MRERTLRIVGISLSLLGLIFGLSILGIASLSLGIFLLLRGRKKK